MLKLTFANRLAYLPETGISNRANHLVPFKDLEAVEGGEFKMAETEGFEPSIRF
ncbi:MAG: hypothetical protein IKE66_12465 [Hyphomicrobium sp.]|nr:hypothetical protein [Hyphomicrobium sp.]